MEIKPPSFSSKPLIQILFTKQLLTHEVLKQKKKNNVCSRHYFPWASLFIWIILKKEPLHSPLYTSFPPWATATIKTTLWTKWGKSECISGLYMLNSRMKEDRLGMCTYCSVCRTSVVAAPSLTWTCTSLVNSRSDHRPHAQITATYTASYI